MSIPLNTNSIDILTDYSQIPVRKYNVKYEKVTGFTVRLVTVSAAYTSGI